jgi:hypothetical protein
MGEFFNVWEELVILIYSDCEIQQSVPMRVGRR